MVFANENEFELALVELLTQKGWEKEVLVQPSEQDLLRNWAKIILDNNSGIDRLNGVPLTDGEIGQLLEQINSLRTPQQLNGFINGRTTSIRRDNPADPLHLGKEVTIKLFSPHEIAAGQSRYQIVRQPRFSSHSPLLQQRRGDVMLLINGMPVIHIELKKSGIPVSQAYNQIQKYSEEGIFSGLFQLIQIFVAMNPEETVYFANPGADGRFNKDFYFHWADFNNNPLNDWKDIATYLLSIPMAHRLIGYYTIADRTDGILKVLRSYQYYAVDSISKRVAQRHNWHDTTKQLGGYVWHTTGSGKTMTSFKSAQLIADSGDADKVVFVIDRIELGTQSAREYRNFSADDELVQETENTQALIDKMKSDKVADTLIVSSIQKLGIVAEGGEMIRPADIKKINQKRIVFIVDECHRSTFGDSFRQIKKTFPTAMFFGFTGTPIKDENSHGGFTTVDIFGDELHRYSISDGIRDKNVLGFDPYKVLTFKDRDIRKAVGLHEAKAESVADAMADEAKKQVFMHFQELPMAGHLDENTGRWINGVEDYVPDSQYLTDEHCYSVVDDIVSGWDVLSQGGKFYGIFTTSSIPQAIRYYRIFKEKAPQLKVTALFDPSLDNDNPTKEHFKSDGLVEILTDYNERYGQSFDIASHPKFKKDLSNRLAHKTPYKDLWKEEKRGQRLDLLIVVSQMLTGFDSKWVNVLYVDKVLYYEELIQAFSRTNRLFGYEKPFGTIRYYNRPHTMEYNIKEAVRAYSGEGAMGLFVNKLNQNLQGLNLTFKEIEQLFLRDEIENFSMLPTTFGAKRQFAKLFRQYNSYLEACKVQGFFWSKLTYIFEDGTEITVNHNEHQYNTLLQRYKELFEPTGGGGGFDGGDPPYEIDPHLTEIDTGKIDAEYMNDNFVRYIRALEQPNITQEELDKVLNDLSTSYASLPQAEQRHAEEFLHDVQSGKVVMEEGKTFRDYINDYMATAKEIRINRLYEIFGLDRDKLRELLNLPITEMNLDEFGRFTALRASVDRAKAKAYFEEKLGQSLSALKVTTETNNLLKKFILNAGSFDIN